MSIGTFEIWAMSYSSPFLMNFLYWNVRGANGKYFPNTIKTFKRLYKLCFVALFEPRFSGSKAQKICRKLGFSNFFIEDARGFSGGIWICWDNNVIDVNIVHRNNQAITMVINHNNKIWIMSAIYASPTPNERRLLWNFLDKISNIVQHPWAIAGDFNEVTAHDEKKGGKATFTSTGFDDWIHNNGFIDLGFQGQPFTWVKNGKDPFSLRQRLDRALSNQSWRLEFPEAVISHIPRTSSDHCPILLTLQSEHIPEPHLKPFRFQSMWMQDHRFKEFVYSNWPKEQ